MAYAYVHDVACSWDSYRQATDGLVEPPPPGLILHLVGPTDEGVRLIDVWESEQAGRQFRLDVLGPALAHLGPAVSRHEVLRHLHPTHLVLGTVPLLIRHNQQGAVMNRTRTTSAALVTTGAVAIAGLLGQNVASSSTTATDGVKAATAKYHSIEQATRDGYSGVNEPCVSSPDGVMGFHYINAALVADPAVDPLKPEILLYAPNKNGRLVLVGIEYLVFDDDQDLTTAADRPFLSGQPFDGPMPGHAPGMPIHYDLHAWVWSDNPSGTYAPFNPTLSCG